MWIENILPVPQRIVKFTSVPVLVHVCIRNLPSHPSPPPVSHSLVIPLYSVAH